MKDRRHILGRLAELATVLERNRKGVCDAIDRLSDRSRDEEVVSETIAVMEERDDEIGEAQGMSEGILETLRDEVLEEEHEVDGDDGDRLRGQTARWDVGRSEVLMPAAGIPAPGERRPRMERFMTALVRTVALAALCSRAIAGELRIEFDATPPGGIPSEADSFIRTTNDPKHLVDLGDIARIQVRFYDTNAFSTATASNYIRNIVSMNPELLTGIVWAEYIGAKPSVEAYITFADNRRPSRWLIWAGRSVLWSPSGRWMYLAWMDDARLRRIKKK